MPTYVEKFLFESFRNLPAWVRVVVDLPPESYFLALASNPVRRRANFASPSPDHSESALEQLRD